MLLAEPLTDRVIGLAIEVHRHTGPGLLEFVYEQCLCHEFQDAGIAFGRQVAIPIPRVKPEGMARAHQAVTASRRITSSPTSLSWRSKPSPPSCQSMRYNSVTGPRWPVGLASLVQRFHETTLIQDPICRNAYAETAPQAVEFLAADERR